MMESTPSLALPTPSLQAQEVARKFRLNLAVMLGLDLIYYILGSVAGVDFTGVDLLLLFIGYYGQDLCRAGALHLYVIFSSVSLVVDTFVLLIRSMIVGGGYMSVIVSLIILYVVEAIAKCASIYYGHKLKKHLQQIPGQSIDL